MVLLFYYSMYKELVFDFLYLYSIYKAGLLWSLFIVLCTNKYICISNIVKIKDKQKNKKNNEITEDVHIDKTVNKEI